MSILQNKSLQFIGWVSEICWSRGYPLSTVAHSTAGTTWGGGGFPENVRYHISIVARFDHVLDHAFWVLKCASTLYFFFFVCLPVLEATCAARLQHTGSIMTDVISHDARLLLSLMTLWLPLSQLGHLARHSPVRHGHRQMALVGKWLNGNWEILGSSMEEELLRDSSLIPG